MDKNNSPQTKILRKGDKNRKEKHLFFQERNLRKEFSFCENYFYYNIKKAPIVIEKLNGNKKLKNVENKIEEIRRKKIKYGANINNAKIRNNIIMILIKFIIINIFCQIKIEKLFDIYHLSKITLKIKGIGESSILGLSSNIKYLLEVKINGNIQETKAKNYYFNQTDNIVELILDDNIKSYLYLEHAPILLKLIYLILILHKLHQWRVCFLIVHH